ncbi:MAG: hypothetical protein E7130_02610 [Rikenellaceae bacterium]|nr:hypothetical protein [Rikenellaceae bacterium]
MSKDYTIAGFRLRINEPYADLVDDGIRGFKPFAVDFDAEEKPVMELYTDVPLVLEDFQLRVLHDFEFEDAKHDCFFCRYDHGYLFYMQPQGGDSACRKTIFVREFGSTKVVSNIAEQGAPDTALLRFGLWVMFGLAINPLHAIAIHSSVIVKDGGAVMFLGESGTGKSTHTRLWRENIEGAKLLNDDSPIIRCVDGVPTVFGSAWSGKTPCYINKSFPIRGIVRLSQAPYNAMRRQGTIESLGALLPSCPPSFAYDNELQDNICDTLSEVLAKVPVYHLECLPDAAAAQLSYNTILGRK